MARQDITNCGVMIDIVKNVPSKTFHPSQQCFVLLAKTQLSTLSFHVLLFLGLVSRTWTARKGRRPVFYLMHPCETVWVQLVSARFGLNSKDSEMASKTTL